MFHLVLPPHLLQVVSLMSDTALLVATLAIAQQPQQQQQADSRAMVSTDAISVAAGRLLESWLPAAQATILGSKLLSREALTALLALWDWRPILQQAASQLVHHNDGMQAGSGHVSDARRNMQRSLRQLADFIRRQPRPPEGK